MPGPMPYQRVTTATDYDSDPAKFPLYLAFDGSDDSMATGSIDFSATDEMTVVAGVTKISTSTGALVELSALLDANNGTFLLCAPRARTSGDYGVFSKGSVSAEAWTGNDYAPPNKTVYAFEADIGSDSAALRIGGNQVASSSGDQGSGNYGNYPLFIGSRNNSSLRFNGRIHQLIVRGKTSADIADAESFVAARTGVTL